MSSCSIFLFPPPKIIQLLVEETSILPAYRWAAGWMIGGSESREGLGIFFFTTASRPALGPIKFPIQWVSWAPSLGLKRPGREADHLPPSNTKVKNAWSYTFTPQYVFTAWCLIKQWIRVHGVIVKHRDNFTLKT